MNTIRTVEALEALYGPAPSLASTAKELDRLTPEYRRCIELSPFVALASVGDDGLDCSPRGDARGFVRVVDERTLMLPDRRGNRRLDTLRNVVRDPRVALLFLIPGSGTTLRVNGRAVVTDDATLRASFAVEGQPACTVLVVTIDRVYFQCARAILRAALWDASAHVPRAEVPTPGQMLQRTSGGAIDARDYDDAWPARAAASMW